MNRTKKILIVDDAESNRVLLRSFLCDQYEIIEACDGQEAIQKIDEYKQELSIVLLDMIMPVVDGYQVLEHMNDYGYIPEIPVISITSDTESGKEEKAFESGVSDFIPKPFNIAVVRKRIENTIDLYERTNNLQKLVEEQTAEIYAQTQMINEQARIAENNNNILIEGLSTVVEFRSVESGEHIRRIKALTNIMYKHIMYAHPEFRITEEDVNTVTSASVLHDIGKIAIPDNILLKPGKLTPEEYEIMKKHSKDGTEILKKFSGFSNVLFLEYAKEICLHHHERIDGNGYPDGLKGDDIPIYVQVVSIADVYDALVSPRIYKPSYTHDKAMDMILNRECGAFSDIMKDTLKACREEIHSLYMKTKAV